MTVPELRVASAADADAIAQIYAPYVSDSAASFELEPPDAVEIGRRIATIGARYPWLVVSEGGKLMGYAYAGEHRSRLAYRWGVDVAVYLHQTAHRRGLGRRLYTALFQLLRELHYVNAYGGITLPNAGSVGLHEAMGFKLIGVYPSVGYKHGAWRDVGWWGLNLTAAATPPQEPAAFPLIDQSVLRKALAAT